MPPKHKLTNANDGSLVATRGTVRRVVEALELADSMKFSKGDEAAEWSDRKPSILAFCPNCKNRWVIGFEPMPSDSLAKVMDRGGFCSRCLEEENIRFFGLESLETIAQNDRVTLPHKPFFQSKRKSSDLP